MKPYLTLLISSAAGVSALVLWAMLRTRQTAADLERERRLRINGVGRIIDGTVVDVQEMMIDAKQVQVLLFNYNVAGVEYEASQDVTYVRHLVDLHSCKLGLPASVKYDPQNPGNSIVVCEEWSGLR